MNRFKVFSNLIWRFAERIGAQGVTFIISIVLARILGPEVYGTCALVTVFITIMQVFVDSGLGNALIQKKDADDLDFSTVFFCNIAICLLLYILMYFFAPLVARFYSNNELTAIVRVMSLTLIISGLKNVQQAYVSKKMLFRKFFFATIGGTIGSAVVGIVLALRGAGVWALVIQNLFNTIVDTIILWITVKWRPKKQFSFERLKGLYSFGWKMLVSSLTDTVLNNIRQLLIGKIYTSSDLAYYNKGKQFPNLIITNITTAIDSVLFSAMSSEQDDKNRVKNMTRRSISMGTYIIAPILIGMAVISYQLIVVLLSEKWVEAVPFLRIFCFAFLIQSVNSTNKNAIKALGEAGLFLKIDIAVKIISLVLLIASTPFGIIAMTMSYLLTFVVSQLMYATLNKKLLNYKYGEQILDVVPNVTLSLVMGIIIYPIGMLPLSNLLLLIIQIIIGMIIYVVMSIITKNKSFFYLWGIFIPRLRNFRG